MTLSLRFFLREETRAAHEQLDRALGDMTCAESYIGFVRGSYAHRVAVEESLATACWPAVFENWRPALLRSLLEADLADLGQVRPSVQPFTMSNDIATLTGVSYVIAGSALGAQLVYRKAQALGFGASHGARHLAPQKANLSNWRSLLALMETFDRPDLALDRQRAADAANAVFAQAWRAMSLNRRS